MPIVVGGTGFYLRWFIYGKPQTPTSTPEAAQRVNAMLAKVGQLCRLHMFLCSASCSMIT